MISNPTTTTTRPRLDHRQTIALDDVAYRQIKKMSRDIGCGMSATMRIIIREAYAARHKDLELGCV